MSDTRYQPSPGSPEFSGQPSTAAAEPSSAAVKSPAGSPRADASARRKTVGGAADTANVPGPLTTRRTVRDGPVSDELVALGRRVAARREQRGWTLPDLAEQSGVSRSTLSAVEHGRQDVTVSRLSAIADALSVPVAWLFVD